MRNRKAWSIAGSLVLAGGFMYLFLRGVVWTELADAATHGNAFLLCVAFVACVAGFAIRAWRWKILASGIGRTRFRTLWIATVVGFAANSVLPARLGEVVRPYVLARLDSVPFGGAIATVVVERILDAIIVFAGLAIYIAAGGLPPLLYEGVDYAPKLRYFSVGLMITTVIAGPLLAWYSSRPGGPAWLVGFRRGL